MYTRLSGRITRQEVLDRSVGEGANAARLIRFNRLIDTRQVEEIDLVFTNLMERARLSLNLHAAHAAPRVRMCILTGSEVGFGMAKMYASLLDVPDSPFKVAMVETVAAAAAFLDVGLSLEQFQAVCALPECRSDAGLDAGTERRSSG